MPAPVDEYAIVVESLKAHLTTFEVFKDTSYAFAAVYDNAFGFQLTANEDAVHARLAVLVAAEFASCESIL
jgi:aminopeptidase-like protein